MKSVKRTRRPQSGLFRSTKKNKNKKTKQKKFSKKKNDQENLLSCCIFFPRSLPSCFFFSQYLNETNPFCVPDLKWKPNSSPCLKQIKIHHNYTTSHRFRANLGGTDWIGHGATNGAGWRGGAGGPRPHRSLIDRAAAMTAPVNGPDRSLRPHPRHTHPPLPGPPDPPSWTPSPQTRLLLMANGRVGAISIRLGNWIAELNLLFFFFFKHFLYLLFRSLIDSVTIWIFLIVFCFGFRSRFFGLNLKVSTRKGRFLHENFQQFHFAFFFSSFPQSISSLIFAWWSSNTFFLFFYRISPRFFFGFRFGNRISVRPCWMP